MWSAPSVTVICGVRVVDLMRFAFPPLAIRFDCYSYPKFCAFDKGFRLRRLVTDLIFVRFLEGMS